MVLTRISVTHPVFTTMMMVALLVLGLFSLQRLGLDQYPKVDVPVVVVAITYPGATPETVETDVTRPVEEALNTVGGLDEITSTSYEGRSVVVAKFKLEVEGATAAQDVRDRVATIEANLPEDTKKPSSLASTPLRNRSFRSRSAPRHSMCLPSPHLPTRRCCGN